MDRINHILNEVAQAAGERFGEKRVTKSYTRNMNQDMMTDPSYTNFYELDRVNLASLKKGDRVRNINSACKNYGSEGYIEDIEDLPDYMGDVVVYRTTNSGNNWEKGDVLKKTRNQLALIANDEEESEEDEMSEYKQELFEMSLSSIKSIMMHSKNILDAIQDENVKENLTESWLQGKIAITEDYMLTIHNFVMFSDESDDIESSQTEKTPDEEVVDYDEFSSSESKPGLWENIRKKKEKMGKKYRPAKPGDKDRPDPEQWKKLTK